MEKRFRVHHIFCTALYEGTGYSGEFCENMTAEVERLKKEPDRYLLLVTGPDMICAGCPNLQDGEGCVLDHNHVEVKDSLLLKPLGLSEGCRYSYRQLCRHAFQTITKEIFDESCGRCLWYRKGLCSFEKLMSKLKTMY